MRKDAVIDHVQVKCPNSSYSAYYNKLTVQVGDLVWWAEGEQSQVGRMIGRVHYAPTLGDTPAIRDYILVAMLGSGAHRATKGKIDETIAS